MSAGTIDAHVHLWDRARNPQPWIEPDTMAAIDRDFGAGDLRAMLAATGAERAVLVQSTNSLTETEDLLAVAASAPAAAVVGWVDLSGDVPGQLAALDPALLTGIRHLAHLEPDPRWLLRADVARGLDALADSGLAFDLIVRAHQLEVAAEVAASHGALRLVLDHLGNPERDGLDEWRRGLEALAAHDNVVAKLSGVAALPEPDAVIDSALDVMGPGRLMYGSDWPLVELAPGGAAGWAAAVRRVTERLTPAEAAAVMHGTAASTYRLPA